VNNQSKMEENYEELIREFQNLIIKTNEWNKLFNIKGSNEISDKCYNDVIQVLDNRYEVIIPVIFKVLNFEQKFFQNALSSFDNLEKLTSKAKFALNNYINHNKNDNRKIELNKKNSNNSSGEGFNKQRSRSSITDKNKEADLIEFAQIENHFSSKKE